MNFERVVQTYTGKYVDILDPDPSQICIEDIAHSLSLINRFNGHSIVPYSVGRHSIEVSKHFTDPKERLIGLMHDAAEAYMGDIPKPIKKDFRILIDPDNSCNGDAYAEIWRTETTLLLFILKVLNISDDIKWSKIWEADLFELFREKTLFMKKTELDDKIWKLPKEYCYSVGENLHLYGTPIEEEFLDLFHHLKKETQG